MLRCGRASGRRGGSSGSPSPRPSTLGRGRTARRRCAIRIGIERRAHGAIGWPGLIDETWASEPAILDFQTQPKWLPLPKGEGRGEGDRVCLSKPRRLHSEKCPNSSAPSGSPALQSRFRGSKRAVWPRRLLSKNSSELPAVFWAGRGVDNCIHPGKPGIEAL
jgi:hypothetical protein